MNAVLNQPKYFSTCRRTKKSKSNVKNKWMILRIRERKCKEGRKEGRERGNAKERSKEGETWRWRGKQEEGGNEEHEEGEKESVCNQMVHMVGHIQAFYKHSVYSQSNRPKFVQHFYFKGY